MFERFGKKRRQSGKRKGRRPGGALLGRVSRIRHRPWTVFFAGLGFGIAIGLALAVHRGPAPNVMVSLPIKNEAPATPAILPAPPLPARAPPPPAPSRVTADKPAWQQFALAMPATAGRPMIAIVIDDMGLDKANAARVIALPGPLTIAFMSYAGDLDSQSNLARMAGDEIWMHIPMQPLDGEVDAGPNVLKTDLSSEEIRRRLDWSLARLPGIVGVNNHMGSKFTQYAPGMTVVMQDLRARGLAFLDSRTIAATVASEVAGQMGVPHIDRDVFIDNDESVPSVLRQLEETERIALRRGFALAIGHPHPTTIAALQQWLPTLKAKGFVLVPASALLRMELSSAG
jgi:polysaccharide deacetylase 2 family uncharacterized protein YibQ